MTDPDVAALLEQARRERARPNPPPECPCSACSARIGLAIDVVLCLVLGGIVFALACHWWDAFTL